jgi:PAS domain S-box-containing protein
MRQRHGKCERPPVLRALAVSIAYFLGAEIGFALTPHPTPVSTLWPPNALLLGALLLAPTRSWPLLIAAVFPAHLLSELNSGVPTGMVLSWFVSNCAEALIGAMLIRRYVKGPLRLDSVRRVAFFVVGGAILPALLSSFLDAGLVKLNHYGQGGYWDVMSARFFSNLLATLAIVPAMLTWGDIPLRLRSIPPRRALEAAWLALGLGLICLFVFEEPAGGLAVTPALLFAPLPFLFWASVRFGPAGVSLSLLVFSLISVWGAIHGRGPFDERSIADNVFSLQLFLILNFIPLLTLTAMIRERATAVEEARSNAQRLQLALTAARMGTWEWDLVHGSGTISREASELMGVAEASTYQHFIDELVHADDRQGVEAAILCALEEDLPYEAEFRVRNGAGVKWLHNKGIVLRNSDGLATRMIGVSTDVTARKFAESALLREATLRESESRFRILADAMPQIVWTARADGQVDYFNRRWYEFTDTKPGPITDHTWLSVVHPADRSELSAAWHGCVASGHPYEHEARFWSARHAGYRWHLDRAIPVRDEAGAIVRWYGTSTDIDDHKRAEQSLRRSESELRILSEYLEQRVAQRTAQLTTANATLREEIDVRLRIEAALRASEERFAKAFRASLDAIAIVQYPTMRVVEINDRWEMLFGYRRSEAIGSTVDDLAIYASRTESGDVAGCIAAQGFIREFELDMRRKNGVTLRAVLAAETVTVDGQPCLIMMVRDITERRRAERELEVQRHELAHLGRVALLGELSGAVAHELNQPLAAILTNARVAQRMMLGDKPDQVMLREILEDMVADSLRAGSVIHRVRGLIRKDDAIRQLVSPNEVVADVLDLAHSDLIRRGITVGTDLAPSIPSVSADRVQLQQVLLNLIVNACDAMADNATRDRTLTIITAEEGSTARISVVDRGPGVAASLIDAVFEPFVTSKPQGLGLGLAICRSIIGAHGGRIWAANNTGRGATFSFVLPVPVAPPTPTRRESARVSGLFEPAAN